MAVVLGVSKGQGTLLARSECECWLNGFVNLLPLARSTLEPCSAMARIHMHVLFWQTRVTHTWQQAHECYASQPPVAPVSGACVTDRATPLWRSRFTAP